MHLLTNKRHFIAYAWAHKTSISISWWIKFVSLSFLLILIHEILSFFIFKNNKNKMLKGEMSQVVPTHIYWEIHQKAAFLLPIYLSHKAETESIILFIFFLRTQTTTSNKWRKKFNKEKEKLLTSMITTKIFYVWFIARMYKEDEENEMKCLWWAKKTLFFPLASFLIIYGIKLNKQPRRELIL